MPLILLHHRLQNNNGSSNKPPSNPKLSTQLWLIFGWDKVFLSGPFHLEEMTNAEKRCAANMKVAYLILAHGQPEHLARLIRALREDWTEIFVHIDRKSAMSDFRAMFSTPQTKFIRNRVSICWSGFSMIQATLNLIAEASSAQPEPDWYVLLSGADYPIRSNDAIYAFLARSRSEHISTDVMPGRDGRKSLSRLETFRFEGALGHPKLRRVILHQTNRLLRSYRRDYRPVLGGMVPYCGGQWWALSRDAISYILQFVESHRRFVNFYKHVLVPDEMFFQTILGNSPFASRIARNLTYVDWTQGIAWHPAPLTEEHAMRFAEPGFRLDDAEGTGPCFFARKFTPSDSMILDRIDRLRRVAESDFRRPMDDPRDSSGVPPYASSGKAS